MTGEFVRSVEWRGTSADPADEQFGHVVRETTLDRGDDFDAVLVGEPFDRAVIGRRGAAEGPDGLRDALAGTKNYHFAKGRVTGVGDLGDVRGLDGERDRSSNTSVRAVQTRLRDVTAAVHDLDALPVFLGGDNSLTYPNVAPLLDRGSVGVVNLDAHLDVREVRDDATSGTPYRQLFDAGLDGYACVGARHFETSAPYADYVHQQGGEIVTSNHLRDDLSGATRRALDGLGDVDWVYVSVDLDVLDASAAPGVSAPTAGGVTTRELFCVLGILSRDDRIAGFEVVECAPPLDSEGMTAAAGARAVAHFLSGYTANRRHHE